MLFKLCSTFCTLITLMGKLQVEPKDRGQAISVIGSNMSAATSMSSISLTLSSLIGAWVGSSSQNIFKSGFIYGDTSSSTISIKYISLLACFLLAFACFVQSARYFVQVNFFISMPNSEIPCCHLAAVDFWPHTNVRLLCNSGGDYA